MAKFNHLNNLIELTSLRTYEFDKTVDLKRVEPCSVMLLSEVIESGVVPPDTSDLEFNEIDDPNNIVGRVTNVFDAIDLSREIAKSASSAKAFKQEGSGSASAPNPSSEVSPSVSTGTTGID